LKLHAPGATLNFVEEEGKNVELAVTQYGVPENEVYCSSVEDWWKWDMLAGRVDLVVDLWTASYVDAVRLSGLLKKITAALTPITGRFLVAMPTLSGHEVDAADAGMRILHSV
tara:strand:- start:7246 stop:7584 length:339 start_codon:yes stop_codon:yes gene_type:complete